MLSNFQIPGLVGERESRFLCLGKVRLSNLRHGVEGKTAARNTVTAFHTHTTHTRARICIMYYVSEVALVDVHEVALVVVAVHALVVGHEVALLVVAVHALVVVHEVALVVVAAHALVVVHEVALVVVAAHALVIVHKVALHVVSARASTRAPSQRQPGPDLKLGIFFKRACCDLIYKSRCCCIGVCWLLWFCPIRSDPPRPVQNQSNWTKPK